MCTEYSLPGKLNTFENASFNETQAKIITKLGISKKTFIGLKIDPGAFLHSTFREQHVPESDENSTRPIQGDSTLSPSICLESYAVLGASHISISSPLSVISTLTFRPPPPPSILSVGPFKTDKGLTKGCSRPYEKGTGSTRPRLFWHSNEASVNILRLSRSCENGLRKENKA